MLIGYINNMNVLKNMTSDIQVKYHIIIHMHCTHHYFLVYT